MRLFKRTLTSAALAAAMMAGMALTGSASADIYIIDSGNDENTLVQPFYQHMPNTSAAIMDCKRLTSDTWSDRARTLKSQEMVKSAAKDIEGAYTMKALDTENDNGLSDFYTITSHNGVASADMNGSFDEAIAKAQSGGSFLVVASIGRDTVKQIGKGQKLPGGFIASMISPDNHGAHTHG